MGVEYNFSEDDIKGLNKADKAAASSAAIDDILGPLKDGSLEAGSNENSLLADGDPYNPSQAGPNYAFIDPTAEDTMIVQYILTSRVGTRELEDSEDESEKPKVENDVKEETKAETSEALESDKKEERDEEGKEPTNGQEPKNEEEAREEEEEVREEEEEAREEKEEEEKKEVIKDEAIEEIK